MYEGVEILNLSSVEWLDDTKFLIAKDMEKRGSSLILGLIQVFAWPDWECHEKLVPEKIGTGHPQNTFRSLSAWANMHGGIRWRVTYGYFTPGEKAPGITGSGVPLPGIEPWSSGSSLCSQSNSTSLTILAEGVRHAKSRYLSNFVNFLCLFVSSNRAIAV
jgi:hypothetical protein